MQELNGCDAEFPPHSDYFYNDVAGGVTDNGDGTLTWVAGGVNTSNGSCTGSRWGPGRSCGPCLINIPSDYDLCPIGDFDDPFTWLRAHITGYNAAAGTITTDKQPFQNAVTAGFVPSIDSLGSAEYRITKTNGTQTGQPTTGGAGLTSRDRRPRKPNEREMWRGVIAAGWLDADGNGQIYEQYNTIDPSAYDTDGGTAPLVNWLQDVNGKTRPTNYFAANKSDGVTNFPADGLLFNSSGGLLRMPVNGNDANHIGFNKSIYKLTVTATTGNFGLTFACSNLSGGMTNGFTAAYNASASTIQTDFAAFNGMSGLVTVTGSGPFVVSFDKTLGFVNLQSDDGATVGMPDDAVAIGGMYILVGSGAKAMPGRLPDAMNAAYTGCKDPYQSHDIANEPTLGSVNKAAFTKIWQAGNPCSLQDPPCVDVEHDVLNIDAQYEIDNACLPGTAGDWVSPDYWKNPGALQRFTVDLLDSFVDKYNPWGDFHGANGPNKFTPATWANETSPPQPGAWTSTLSVSNTGTGTVASVDTIDASLFPIGVWYTVLTAGNTIKESGTATLNADGTLDGPIFNYDSDSPDFDDGLAIDLWASFKAVHRDRVKYLEGRSQFIADIAYIDEEPVLIDPPAITPGGFLPDPDPPSLTLGQSGNISSGFVCSYRTSTVNASGETNASTGVAITALTYVWNSSSNTSTPILTPTYSVTLSWTPESGASIRNIYGERNGSGGELFMIGVPDYLGTWIDDGSIVPSGDLPTSNTTSSDCAGVGLWSYRLQSSSLVSTTTNGFINDGDGRNIPTGTLARCIGDTRDSAFSGKGAVQIVADRPTPLDAKYWDAFARTKHRKSIHLQQINQSSGSIVWSNKWSIFNPTARFLDDGINTWTDESSYLRVQGGQFNAGGGTSATDTDYDNFGTDKACWFGDRSVGSYRTGETEITLATSFSFMIIEIYEGGTPAGWAIDESGTALFTTPVATGHTGTFTNGSSPSITSFNSTSGSMTNSTLHATGLPQPVFIQGSNFNTAGMTVTLTSPDSMTVIPLTIGSAAITPGELKLGLVTFPRGSNGSWGAVVTDPVSNLSSGAVAMPVGLMQAVPNLSFNGPTFTFAYELDTPCASLDGYLIKEPRYTMNRWAGKVFTITPASNASSPIQVVSRYSDNNSLYFDARSNSPTGTYSCLQYNQSAGEQYVFGGTYQLSTGKPTVASGLVWCEGPPDGSTPRYWVQPTGDDPRKNGVKFKKQIWNNVSTKVSTYGYASLLDDFTLAIPNQLYYMLIDMEWTWRDFAWSLPPDDEPNSTSYETYTTGGMGWFPGGSSNGGDPPNGPCDLNQCNNFDNFDNALTFMKGDMTSAAKCDTGPSTPLCDACCTGGDGITTDTGAVPHSVWAYYGQDYTSDGGDATGFITQAADAATNFASMDFPCTKLAAEIDFYAKGQITSNPDAIPATSSVFEPDGTTPGFEGVPSTYVDDVIFDSGGVPISYDTWDQFSSTNVSSGSAVTIYSATALGDLTLFPTFPSPVAASGNFKTVTDQIGWYAGKWGAIVKWKGNYVESG